MFLFLLKSCRTVGRSENGCGVCRESSSTQVLYDLLCSGTGLASVFAKIWGVGGQCPSAPKFPTALVVK